LQSNVNFLQQLVTKNAAEARARLNAAQAEIVALKGEVAALKSAVTSLHASVVDLQKAQKAAAEKKPAGK
jgi:predicted  nucleic acid-binding Zn-ribbon protein